jgi:3-hydroxyacyl-CoA dehydrogenase
MPNVHHHIDNGVCTITLDNPPLNVIGRALREGLAAALDAAEAAGVGRVIVTGAGSAFAAGADAREFDAPPAPPHLPDLLLRLARLPAIAAINGAALGGGLEIALACRARIASPRATLGLPEVTLGVVPGAGGTQRLPRIIGLRHAAELIAEGRIIGAADALSLGLVDAVAEDPVAAARAFPNAALVGAADRPAPAPQPEALAAIRAGAAKRARGQIAPGVALDLVELSASLPLAEGLARERAAFLDLRQGEQARALRHVFFAERAASARARSFGAAAPGVMPAEIGVAVVVGGGTMGAAIAYALEGVGVAVTVVETDESGAERARGQLSRLFEEAVARGKLGAEAAAARLSKLRVVIGYDALPAADLAIEAVFEDLDVKRTVFAALAAALPPTAILATNTSYLDVDRIFVGIPHPERCLGLHFFAPAHVMKLVEIVRAARTSEPTLAAAFRLAQRLRKIAVEAGVCDGFIGNRILTRYRQTTDIALIEGATPWAVDAAMEAFGMAMGPYAVQDLSGLQIAYANRRRKNMKERPGIRYIPIADRLVESGRLGAKSGSGWHDHAESGRRTPSPLVREIVEAASAEAGLVRRDIPDDEIRERALTAMIEEGLHILDEGMARSPADIDLVMIHGYGFPRWRGGPMHEADRIGLPALLARIEAFAAEDPLSWRAPPLLRRLVSEGRPLSSLAPPKGA